MKSLEQYRADNEEADRVAREGRRAQRRQVILTALERLETCCLDNAEEREAVASAIVNALDEAGDI